MTWYDTILQYLPQVEAPPQKKLDFSTKLKWTLIVLGLYFTLKHIPLFGLGPNGLAQFQQLSTLLGADFGSLISLGISPIVTAGIILQLLNGSGLIKFDTNTHQGKARFQGTNKLLGFAFVIIQACIFVFLGGLAPAAIGETMNGVLMTPALFVQLEFFLVFQIILGGILIMFLDDLVAKWGLTSGISLFIAASVSESLFIQTFSWFSPGIESPPVGAIPQLLYAFSSAAQELILPNLVAIASTVVIFLVVVFFQSMKVEIPLSFGRVRGFGVRWPLNFLYTSVIPVTLVAALLANIQLVSVLVERSASSPDQAFLVLGQSLSFWFEQPRLVQEILTSSSFLAVPWQAYVRALWYILILAGGSVLFAWFWMQTSGMDAHSVAKQIMASGLQIPGFRSDPRVIEHILARYIGPLTIMGGLTIGVLSALADILGSLTSGTGLLLAVMIVYRMYEDIAKQHISDMNPALRQFMGRGN